jgi:hypothetical protein
VPLVLPGLAPIQITPEIGAFVGSFVPPSADKGGQAVARTDPQHRSGSATDRRQKERRERREPRPRSPEKPSETILSPQSQGIISLRI